VLSTTPIYPRGVCCCKDMIAGGAVSKEILSKRLRGVERQVRGIERLIEEDRKCDSIITQLGAVRSAIESIAVLLLSNYTKICFGKETTECVEIESLARAIAIRGRLQVSDEGGYLCTDIHPPYCRLHNSGFCYSKCTLCHVIAQLNETSN
jgi:DNA-binding FrmR family transcriptional regulator